MGGHSIGHICASGTHVVVQVSGGIGESLSAPPPGEVPVQTSSQWKPGPQSIGPDEKYLGPIFDESAVRFFLVYNSKLKQFLYILDESGPPADILVTSLNDALAASIEEARRPATVPPAGRAASSPAFEARAAAALPA